MKNIIKISAVNSKSNKLPEGANPYIGKIDFDIRRKYVDGNLEKMYAFLHEAGKSGTDLVCTCEDFSMSTDPYMRYMEDPQLFSSLAEEIPGPLRERIREIAEQYGMLVAANFYEKDGNKIFNTSVLIGRDGKIIGKYRKIHLPVCEKWMVTPGDEFCVFETDIGRIGFAVCYDIVFGEHCRSLALNGADIIIHPTAGWGVSGVSSSDLGEALIRVRAAENAVYMVVSTNNTYGGIGKSCIVDNNGEIIAKAAGEDEGIATAEFTADFDIVREEIFDTFFSGISSIKARQTLERLPGLYKLIAEDESPLYERYKDMKLLLDQENVNEKSRQWIEHVRADMENRPSSLKYHW